MFILFCPGQWLVSNLPVIMLTHDTFFFHHVFSFCSFEKGEWKNYMMELPINVKPSHLWKHQLNFPEVIEKKKCAFVSQLNKLLSWKTHNLGRKCFLWLAYSKCRNKRLVLHQPKNLILKGCFLQNMKSENWVLFQVLQTDFIDE